MLIWPDKSAVRLASKNALVVLGSHCNGTKNDETIQWLRLDIECSGAGYSFGRRWSSRPIKLRDCALVAHKFAPMHLSTIWRSVDFIRITSQIWFYLIWFRIHFSQWMHFSCSLSSLLACFVSIIHKPRGELVKRSCQAEVCACSLAEFGMNLIFDARKITNPRMQTT